MKPSKPALAVLVSGQGTNLQSIIDHVSSGKLDALIEIVVSDKAGAYALERSKKAGIRCATIDPAAINRDDFDRELIKILSRHDIELIVLAGFMKILSPKFLSLYPDKVINIHPSLLPRYPGLKSIQKAFENRDKETGVTVHYVNEGVDTGPIILQERVPIDSSDTLETLTEKIHRTEHQIYPKAIQKVLWKLRS